MKLHQADFLHHLRIIFFFIHLNKKVNSQKEVTKFLNQKNEYKDDISKINSLGEMLVKEKIKKYLMKW